MLVDNRDLSLDSRMSDYGLIDTTAVLAKPLYILASPGKPEDYGKTIQ